MDKLSKILQWNINSLKEVVESFKQLEELSLILEWDKKKELDNIIQNCYAKIKKIIENFEKYNSTWLSK